MNKTNTPYPRPHLKRRKWVSLDGMWAFMFDPDDVGIEQRYFDGNHDFSNHIEVPFAYQVHDSIESPHKPCEIMWYQKRFVLQSDWIENIILLTFIAVDHETDIWINGYHATHHVGGYSTFSLDVTPYLKDDNVITMRVVDRYDVVQPRGKQAWKDDLGRCWYPATSGIWQSVFLETVGKDYLDTILMTPNIDRNSVEVELFTAKGFADQAQIEVFYHDIRVKSLVVSLDGKHTKICIE
jgi:hypothetical protein